MPKINGHVLSLSRQDQVYEILSREIQSGRRPIGSCLESIKEMALRFDVSSHTIHNALERLGRQGMIVKRHGSGTYVAATDPELTTGDMIVLCMSLQGHVFGDLAAKLQFELQAEEYLPICIDSNHPRFERMLRRAALSNVDTFVVHGNAYFNFSLLDMKPLSEKIIVGILNWDTDQFTDRVSRVLIDHAKGGRLVAQHLLASGHRRALLVGNDTMLWQVQNAGPLCMNGTTFRDAWRDNGGIVEILPILEMSKPPNPNEVQRILGVLSRPDAPTAVFALMDSHGRRLQTILQQHAPALLDRLEIVGYGDTPWSQTSQPPFSSVDWDLDAVVRATCETIRNQAQARAAAEPRQGRPRRNSSATNGGPSTGLFQPTCVWIEPRLIVRGKVASDMR
jgi:DNA-binding LacI/PurR family transcriptional regulator